MEVLNNWFTVACLITLAKKNNLLYNTNYER